MFLKEKVFFVVLCFALSFYALGTGRQALAGDFDPMGKAAAISDDIAKATNGNLQISGYINGHYMIHRGLPKLVGKDLGKPMWQIREASLFVDAFLIDDLIFSTELETSYDFTTQTNSGRDRRFEALLNYYYFDYDLASAFDWDTDTYGNLVIRVGRILVPFLSYNENKPNFKQNLMSQPFTAWQLAPVNNVAVNFQQFGWTDLGTILNWNHMVGDTGIFDAKLTVMNGLRSDAAVLDSNHVTLDTGPGPNVRPRDGLGNAKSSWDDFSDNNDNKAIAVKLSFSPFAFPVNLGVSWYRGKWDNDDDDDLEMYGAHISYIEKDWTVKAEYVKADVDQTAGVNIVPAPGPGALNTSTGNYEMDAWYIEGSYIPYRYGSDDNNYVKLIARYDDVDTNDEVTFTPFDRSRVTYGTEWGFLNGVRLRYEWQRHSIDSFSNAPGPYIAAGGKKNIYMNMISLIANF